MDEGPKRHREQLEEMREQAALERAGEATYQLFARLTDGQLRMAANRYSIRGGLTREAIIDEIGKLIESPGLRENIRSDLKYYSTVSCAPGGRNADRGF